MAKQVKFHIDTGHDDVQDGIASPASGSSAKPAPGPEVGGSSSSATPESPKSSPFSRLTLKNVVQSKVIPTLIVKKTLAAGREDKRRGGMLDQGLRGLDFKNLGNMLRKDEDGSVMSQLWAEVKRRTLLRHQTIERAFRSVDTSGDGAIQFLEFQALFRNIGITVDNRCAQFVFQKAAGGDRELTLEEFKNILMKSTLERLRSMIHKFEENRKVVRSHVDVFLRRVALASERNRRTTLYRFQRKISVDFCECLRLGLKKHILKSNETEFSADTFIRVISGVSSTRFQAYELDFFLNLFASVDRRRRGVSDVLDLYSCLTLLGSEMTREEKLGFLFKVFDTDDDGCLTHEQILKMYCCAVIHSAIARDDHTVREADVAFGDELSLQEARRLFEITLQALSAHGTLDSDARLQSFDELWQVLGGMSEILLDRLVPGTNKAAWLVHPSSHKMKSRIRGDHRRAVAYDPQSASSVIQALNSSGSNFGAESKDHTLEAFRSNLTRSFRHAVRGEWEAVSVLRTSSANPSRALDSTDEDDGAYDSLPAWDPPAQGDPGWSEKHNRTLTEWVRNATMPTLADKEQMRSSTTSLWRSTGSDVIGPAIGHGMRASQSEPILPKIDQRKSFAVPSTQDARNGRRMSGGRKPRSSTSQVTSLPNLLPTPAPRNDIDACWQCGAIAVERFGPQAMPSFNHFSREKAAQRRKFVEFRPLCYGCHLCSDQHELQIQSDPFS
eukprot:gnl/MRDRNA2_/MRDRNA2_111948_c0_seq1.p1 gnl/MRDRNA2_/MRDRNA2_111948_c0~~gnl/MRDRNA2_/MRDRNA2_111948_c0_seq1.p1  ORF type:complete len:727 (+),score=114.50 gnl/MRDRNA2_/MRDRNA2_111948_c0_seq1:82-2262(+)